MVRDVCEWIGPEGGGMEGGDGFALDVNRVSHFTAPLPFPLSPLLNSLRQDRYDGSSPQEVSPKSRWGSLGLARCGVLR